jgi:peptide/nickel transport system substrate-binding protein
VRRHLVAAFAVVSFLLASAPPAASVEPVTLRVGVVAPIGSLDLRDGTGDVAREVWRLQYPTLVAYDDATLAPVASVANAWTPTPDGRGWRYTIDDDAVWSDGETIKADDVIYSLEHARDEHWPYAGDMLDELTAVKVYDTVVDITSSGDRRPPALLPLHIVPKHVFERGTDVDEAGTVSSGPWHVVERTENAVRLAAVDRPGRPPLDEITFTSYGSADALLAALDRGEVDIAGDLPASALSDARNLHGVTAIHADDGDQWLLDTKLTNRDARLAIASGIDRDRLIARAADGVGRSKVLPIVARDASWALPDDAAQELEAALSYAPTRAQRLAADSGVTNVTLAVPDEPQADEIASFLTESLGALGIDVETTTGNDADLVLRRRAASDDPLPALQAYTCAAGRWCDAAYDASFAQLQSTTDTATRHDLVHAMSRTLAADAIEVDLFTPDRLQAYRTDHVTGMLREPRDERLVAFWPGVEHYSAIVPAQVKGGQDPPTSIFVTVTIVVVAIALLAVAIIAWLRRSRKPVDGDVPGTVGGEGLATE